MVASSEKQLVTNKVVTSKTKQEPPRKEEKLSKAQPKSLNTNSPPKVTHQTKEHKADNSKKHSHPITSGTKQTKKKEDLKSEEEDNNNLDLADAELLSKQPSEKIGETYKV